MVTFDNRVTRGLGIEIPIANAPMGGVVTPALVAAMAETGGLGMMPTSMARNRDHIREIRELTDRPIGANIQWRFAESNALDVLIEEGVRFVTTSTGPVPKTIPRMHEAGITVFHVVTSLETARRAVDAGVDGLVVEEVPIRDTPAVRPVRKRKPPVRAVTTTVADEGVADDAPPAARQPTRRKPATSRTTPTPARTTPARTTPAGTTPEQAPQAQAQDGSAEPEENAS